MASLLEITFPIAPVAWQRVKRGKYGQAYVPKKTKLFEQQIHQIARSIYKGPPLKGPLILTAKFFIMPPLTIKRLYPSVRPDLDNYMKALKDGLNGVLYEDDSQICQYGEGTGKYYAIDQTPRIETRLFLI